LAVYQKNFDILLMPFPRQTHFVYYMSPLKMFEYMAAKRPIIATDLLSIREVLSEKNAILVPSGEPKRLATAIENLYRDPSLGEKLADQAYLDVQDYTWQKRAEKIISSI
ncbi:MAG: glycosyltransferase, partial [Candidatus Sungbacteria bacterium]|nr:glycosyltransferase [Candidatus Sungbacteria bacterium]